jgi:hypothetical protein
MQQLHILVLRLLTLEQKHKRTQLRKILPNCYQVLYKVVIVITWKTCLFRKFYRILSCTSNKINSLYTSKKEDLLIKVLLSHLKQIQSNKSTFLKSKVNLNLMKILNKGNSNFTCQFHKTKSMGIIQANIHQKSTIKNKILSLKSKSILRLISKSLWTLMN